MPVALYPWMERSARADIGPLCACGIALGCALVLAAPVTSRRSPIRRWFWWTDAWSPAQRHALSILNAPAYYRAAAADGYAKHALPYLLRLAALSLVLGVCQDAVHGWARSGVLVVDVLAAFVPFYVAIWMLMALASLPWHRLGRS